ncbi:MAG: hypothetical protein QW692_00620 [Nitrososphaerota archaeon]
MMRIIDDETGLPLEAAEKIKKRLQSVEDRVKVIEVGEMGYALGSPENPVADVIAENITIVSEKKLKTDIRELKDEELDLPLPKPKAYKINGKELIGFMAEEMPEKIKTPGGYSLNMLIALLAYKINKLEQEINKLKQK